MDVFQGKDFVVPGNSFAVFEYSLVAPMDRTSYRSNLMIQTPYEARSFPVSFTIEEGAIVSIPDKLIFADAFPGKMSSQALQVGHLPCISLLSTFHMLVLH